MRTVLLLLGVLGASWCCIAAAQDLAFPFEADSQFAPANPIDELVLQALRDKGISPAHLCSDEVFVRRVFLDVIGRIPEPDEVIAFLEDGRPDKRALLIETLFQRGEYAEYWALKWCDLLRVKAEFPINLWPNAVQAYHHWIRDAMRDNMPYDAFARALLTSSGSNFRVPPVNFYRATQRRDPGGIADAVALTFMGTRLEHWSEKDRAALETFFSRVAYKSTAEWKEEIVYCNPAPCPSFTATFPDGVVVEIGPGTDPRLVFANWLIQPEDPWFTRNIANRAWSWLMGRGIIHEPDDLRPDNPPANAALLAYLEKELVTSGYDLRHVFRLILNSRTYQQSSVPRSNDPAAEALFAHYIVRQLDAEVLIDALCRIFGSTESYESPIPEPFTFIPERNPSVTLADGSITSPFLEMFGRPARDTGYEAERNSQPTDAQRLHMLNSSHIQKKIQSSVKLRDLLQRARTPRRVIDQIYLVILSRRPVETEIEAVEKYIEGSGLQPQQAAADVVWALINSKEFLFRH